MHTQTCGRVNTHLTQRGGGGREGGGRGSANNVLITQPWVAVPHMDLTDESALFHSLSPWK